MPTEQKPKDLDRAIDALLSKRSALVDERDALHQKLTQINSKIAELNGIIRALSLSFRARPTAKYKPSVPIFPDVSAVGPNAKIGDAMEAILTEAKKPLPKDEIIEKLRENGVGISLNNPKIVLAIVIKRDKKKRFVASKDGRVALVGGK